MSAYVVGKPRDLVALTEAEASAFTIGHGYPCCCAECTGPDGTDCRPDLWGDCERCGRKAVHDDPDGQYVAAIMDRLDAQAEGQTSWL